MSRGSHHSGPADFGDADVLASIWPNHKPRPVAGATWQAGVSPHSEMYRVLLDGEPVAGAIAACLDDRREGWVDVVLSGHGGAPTIDEAGHREFCGQVVRRRGHVEIVKDRWP